MTFDAYAFRHFEQSSSSSSKQTTNLQCQRATTPVQLVRRVDSIAYAVVAWLLMQIATQVFPFLEIPNWAIRLVIMLIVIGFPIALVIAWAFEPTPEGLKRTEFADELFARANSP